MNSIFRLGAVAVFSCLLATRVQAADRTWTGGGASAYWQNASNWGGTAPTGGDALRFSGAANTATTNDFASGTSFGGLTFQSDASAFSLDGNPVLLGGDIVNNSVFRQTIGLPLWLTAGRTVNASNGPLVFANSLVYTNLGNAYIVLKKTGTNELVFTGTTIAVYSNACVNLEQGTLRFASGSHVELVDTNMNDTARFQVSVGETFNKKAAIVVETNASLTVGDIMVQRNGSAANTNSFDLLVNGTFTISGYEATFGDQLGNRIRCVVYTNGLWQTGSNTWISAGTRSPMTLELNGGSIWFANFGMGRQGSSGDRPGRTDVSINQGLFYINNNFGWMSSNSSGRTNTVTLGNGVTNIATLSTLAMSQASTTGTTIFNLNGGTLLCRANSTSFLSGLDQVNILAGGALIDTGTNVVTFVEALTHADALGTAADGGLIKRGSGSLVLSGGPHSFNGPLRVEDGSLRIAGAMATNLAEITLAPGKTLRFLGSARQVLKPALLSLGDPSIASRLDFDAASDGSDCDTILIPAGGYVGKLNINLYIRNGLGQENSVTQTGDYPLFTYVSEPPDTSLLTYVNRSFGITSAFVVDRVNKQVILRLTASSNESTWTNTTGGAWETASNWTPGSPASATASRARLWSAITSPASVTLGTSVTLGGLSFSSAIPYTLSGSGLLTLASDSGSAYFTADAGTHTNNLALNLASQISTSVASSQSLVLNGSISGSGGITKTGSGALLLTAANTFAGGITLAAGTLTITNASALGSGVLSLAGGTFQPNTSLALNGQLASAAGGVIDTGANTLRLDGLLDWTGTGTLSKAGSGTLTLAGSCNENNTGMSFNFKQGTTRLLNGARYSLRGANRSVLQTSYTSAGQTSALQIDSNAVLSAGGLWLMNGGAAGTSTVYVAGGRLEFLDTECTVVNATGGRGDFIIDGGGSLYSASKGFFSLGTFGLGTLAVSNGTASIGYLTVGGYGDTVGNGNRNGRGQITVGSNGRLEVRDYLTWITDNVGLPSSLRVDGGTLTIPPTTRATNSTGTASLTLNGGTLVCGGAATYTSASAPAPSFTNFLCGVDAILLGVNGTTIDTQTYDLSILQTLNLEGANTSGLTKRGAGALSLSLANTFAAPIAISAGTLALKALPVNSSVAVASGARLAFSANATSTETVGAAAFAANSALTLDLGASGASDRLAVSSALSLAGPVSLFLNNAQVGSYTLFTYGSLAGSASSLRVANPDATLAYTFADTGSAITLTIASSATVFDWANDADGSWSTAANWNPQTVPNGAGHVARFALALTQPRTVTLGANVAVADLLFNSAVAPILAGTGVLTLTNDTAAARVDVAQGSPEIDASLALPSTTLAQTASGSTLTLKGNLSGTGSLAVQGGGTLGLNATNTVASTAVTDGSTLLLGVFGSQEAPLTLDNATLATAGTSASAAGIVLGAFGAAIAPASNATLTLSGPLSGPGGLNKTGASTLALTGSLAYNGGTTVNGGTLSLTSLPSGLTLGAGTLAYTGANATWPGYTVNVGTSTVASVFQNASDLVITGAVTATSGGFVKTGAGNLTFAYPGRQTLGTTTGPTQDALLNIGANGDAPTQGFTPFSIVAGTVTLGADGQVNTFSANVRVGAYSATNASAETAAHLVVNGGETTVNGMLAIGRGNGNATTAPTPLVSTLTVNGGSLTVSSFSLGNNGGNTVGYNAAPRFDVNGGTVSATDLNIGEHIGSTASVAINAGTVTVSNVQFGHLSPGGNGTLAVNGGLVSVANSVNLGVSTSATGTLRLAGGTLSAVNVTAGSGTGTILFDGGTLNLSSGPMSNVQALVLAGGARLGVASGRFTVGVPLLTGVASDGGLAKVGAGMLALDAGTLTNTYTGPTVVEAGTLSLRGANAQLPATTTLTVKPGATFNTSSELTVLPRTVTVSGLTLGSTDASAAYAGLSLWQGAGNQTDTLVVNGTAVLGRVALALYQLGTTAASPYTGVFPIISYSGSDPDVSGLTVINADATLTYAFSVDSANKRVLLTISAGATADAVWTSDTDGVWSVGANWQSGTAPTAIAADALFANVLSQNRTVAVDANASVGGLAFDSTNRYTLAGTGTLTLNAGAQSADITLTRGNHTIAAPLAVPTAVNVALATSSNTLTLASNISGGTDSALTLSASGGTVRLTNSVCGAAVTVTAGTLDLANGSQVNGTLRYGPGQITASGSATVAGSVELQPGLKSLPVAAGATLAVSGAVNGQGTLAKDNGGTLELSAANGYSGNTRVRAGTLALRGSGTPGTGAVGLEGGTLASTGSAAVSFANPIGFTNDTTVLADAPLTTAGALVMATPRALTKQGSNVWSIANVLNGGGTNDSYHIYLRNGTLRFAPGSSFCMASTTTGSRNQFDASVGGANNAMGLVVETNADVTIGSLGVQFSSSTTGTFYMAVNGGRLTMTAPDNPLGFGDSSNLVMTVAVNGGQWITVSDAAWCDLGTRCPLTWIQNGGFVSFGRPTFGRQNGSGSGRWFGGVNMSIFGGTFEARQLFSWKSTDYNAVTNSLTLGNGTPGQGKFSVPATKRYHTGGKVFFAFNGGVLETRGLFNSADGSMVGSLNDYLYGVDAITVGPGGAFIDTLTNSVAISQPLTKLGNDGGLVKLGAGTLVFSNSVSLAGPIAVSNGTLRAAGFSGTNDLFLASGGVLDLTPLTAISQSAQFRNVSGTGTASNGTLAVFGTLSPGSTNGAPGTLSADNLTLLAGAKLRYDWTAQTNDLFAVKGLLTAQAGGTIDFGHAVGDELPIPFSAVMGTYGTFSGAFGSWKAVNTGLPANVAVSSTMTAQNGVVTLSIKYSGLVILIK